MEASEWRLVEAKAGQGRPRQANAWAPFWLFQPTRMSPRGTTPTARDDVVDAVADAVADDAADDVADDAADESRGTTGLAAASAWARAGWIGAGVNSALQCSRGWVTVRDSSVGVGVNSALQCGWGWG